MDESHLDKKYFIDGFRYNCPFCNRRSVTYKVAGYGSFDWSVDRTVYYYRVQCGGCDRISFHLSDVNIGDSNHRFSNSYWNGKETVSLTGDELDSLFFYHQPTSFFTVDSRIPRFVRELISEADGCAKMGHMVGASGALRKAIYEFLKDQKAEGASYEDKIKTLKEKFPQVPSEYFDALSNIQGMTSEELHEQEGSWEPWKKKDFDFILQVVHAALCEIYVVPDDRKKRLNEVLAIKQAKKTKKEEVGEVNVDSIQF